MSSAGPFPHFLRLYAHNFHHESDLLCRLIVFIEHADRAELDVQGSPGISNIHCETVCRKLGTNERLSSGILKPDSKDEL